MKIEIDYYKLVKPKNADGKEIPIESALANFSRLREENKLSVDATENFETFFGEMQSRGANTVEQALRQFLADYLTHGKVGSHELADQQYVEKQFFNFVEDYLPYMYHYDMASLGPCHFPKYTETNADYDWSAIFDLIDPEVLMDKSKYTRPKYHLETYLFEIIEHKTYYKKINTRLPYISISDFATYYSKEKEKQAKENDGNN